MNNTTKALCLKGAKRYLSEKLDDLPQDCFFNKILCGAGGTRLAITNDKPYIIAVPTTDLIISKESQHNNLLGIYGKVSKEAIKNYLTNGGNKLMVTYHSLPKVVEALGDSIKDFQLLVDEAHMLTEGDDKDFMHGDINYILQTFKKFKSYCFMTATPFPRECFPEQIKDIPYIEAQWDKEVLIPVRIIAQHITTRYVDYICKIALDYLEGSKEGNAYFFYNSVEGISQVCYKLIKAGYAKPEDIRIICADKNSSYIKKYVHKDLEIQSVTSEPKKLNFITAKAFEGTDIMDEQGVTYVCADAKKKHTRLEIHTKIPQIVNRIRNSIYNEEVYLLYSKSFITHPESKQQYLKTIEIGIDRASIQSEEIKELPETIKELLNYELLETSEFFTKDLVGNYIPNVNAGKRAIALWEAANVTYSVFNNTKKSISNLEIETPLIKILQEGGNTNIFELPQGVEKVKLGGKKANFKKMCLDYLKAIEEKDLETITFIEDYDPIFKLSRQTFKNNLEYDMSAVSYNQSRLEKRLGLQEACNSDNLKETVYSKFRVNSVVPKNTIKDKLQTIYEENNIDKLAKSTDIKKYFEVKPTTNTKGDNCFKIIKKL